MGLGTPDDADEPVGVALSRMRKRCKITGARLAEMVGMSQPKISRIETGRGPVDPRDVGVIARALGASETDVQALVARAERSQNRMTDWRATTSGLANQQQTLAEWEAAATELRVFEPVLVPGPLQTSGYAKAIFQALQNTSLRAADNVGEAALLAAVSARIRRQEILVDRSKSFRFVLGEAALKPRMLSDVEMLAQIGHIRNVATGYDNVTIEIVPDSATGSLPMLHGFTLLDDRVVTVELYNTTLISRSREDLENYQRVFEAIEEWAIDIGPSLDHYQGIYIDRLRSPRGEVV